MNIIIVGLGFASIFIAIGLFIHNFHKASIKVSKKKNK